jgi:hypothetical protein
VSEMSFTLCPNWDNSSVQTGPKSKT